LGFSIKKINVIGLLKQSFKFLSNEVNGNNYKKKAGRKGKNCYGRPLWEFSCCNWIAYTLHYIYTRAHTHILHTYIHTYIYRYICVCMCVRIHTHVGMYLYISNVNIKYINCSCTIVCPKQSSIWPKVLSTTLHPFNLNFVKNMKVHIVPH